MKTTRFVFFVAIASFLAACSGTTGETTTTAGELVQEPTTTAEAPTDGATTTSAPPSGDESPTTTAASADADITIVGFSFTGATSVPVGSTVAVTNEDAVGHTWTSDDGIWDSGTLSSGDTFQFTFDEPGEYNFFCKIHPSMTGSITVDG